MDPRLPTGDNSDPATESRKEPERVQAESFEGGDDDLQGPSPIMKIPLEIMTKIFIICRNNTWHDDDTYPNILDAFQAPLVLCTICRNWRTVARGTPRLWDVVCLITTDLVSNEKMAVIRELFGLSGSLLLTVEVVTKVTTRRVPGNGNTEFWHRIWELRDRLEHLRVYIGSQDVVASSLPPPTELPKLQSLGIIISGPSSEASPVLPAVLGLFREARSLRALDLHDSIEPQIIPHIFTSAVFPWQQLTTLKSSLSVTTIVARDILRLCRGLEICTLELLEPVDIHQQAPACVLDRMRSLKLGATSDIPFIGFFDSLAFPSLESLTLDMFPVPSPSLLQLHERSQFRLKSLHIDNPGWRSDEILQFLRLQATVETLSLFQCDESGTLFKSFTYRGATSSAPLTLPRLTKLQFAEYYGAVRRFAVPDPTPGPAAAEMAESLLQYPGDRNLCFPLLEPVRLDLRGLKFPDDIEDRLATVCSAGYAIVEDEEE